MKTKMAPTLRGPQCRAASNPDTPSKVSQGFASANVGTLPQTSNGRMKKLFRETHSAYGHVTYDTPVVWIFQKPPQVTNKDLEIMRSRQHDTKHGAVMAVPLDF